MSTTKFYWNDETINYFQDISTEISGEQLYEEIQEFIGSNCTPEDNETEEELVNDLFSVF